MKNERETITAIMERGGMDFVFVGLGIELLRLQAGGGIYVRGLRCEDELLISMAFSGWLASRGTLELELVPEEGTDPKVEVKPIKNKNSESN